MSHPTGSDAAQLKQAIDADDLAAHLTAGYGNTSAAALLRQRGAPE